MVLDEFYGPLNDSQRQSLQQAMQSSDRLLSTIDHFLNQRSNNTADLSLDMKPCDVRELIQSIIDEQQSSFDKKHQRVAIRQTAKHVKTLADAYYLRIALENIIENANKYSLDNASITITIDQKDSRLLITVSDEGVGIREQDLTHIFGKYNRAHNHGDPERSGTGLGLYWSKLIIEKHSGSITANSTVGHGSEFTISLPLSLTTSV